MFAIKDRDYQNNSVIFVILGSPDQKSRRLQNRYIMVYGLKKTIIGAILFGVGLLTAPAALAADGNLYFSPSSTTVANNCYPKLDVMLDTGGQETTGVDVIINYDSAKLEVHNLSQGTLYTSYDTLDTATAGKIVIQARALPAETFYTTAGTGQKLATIMFHSKQNGDSTVTFKYLGQGNTTDTNIAGVDGTDILGASVGNATVKVQDGASCPGSGDSGTGGGDDDEDDDDDDTAPTPTVYTAPASGSTGQTVALILGSVIFLSLSLAAARIRS